MGNNKNPGLSRKIFLLLSFILVFSSFFLSCNIFSLFSKVSFSSTTSLLNEADMYYQRADFKAAMENYQKVMEKDPENSKARLGYVNSFARLRFVDFLYIAQEVSKTNFNPKNLLNDPIVRDNVVGTSGVFQVSIDVLSKIVNGECDGAVPVDDFSVNIQLACSHLLRGLILMGDSDNDGVIASSNDLMIFDDEGMPTVNMDVINFSNIMMSMNTAATMSSQTNGRGDPFALLFSLTTVEALTNLQTGSNSSMRYFLEGLHDSIEASLSLFKVAMTSISSFDNAVAAVNRLVTRYSSSPTVGEMARNISKVNDDIRYVSDQIETPFASTLNDFHKQITGQFAYSGSVRNFNQTSFASHMASPGGMIGILAIGSNVSKVNLNDAESIVSMFSNFMTSVTNPEMTAIVDYWMNYFSQTN